MPDYTLGRGRVLFRQTGTNGFLDLGNCPDFKINVASEILEHYSSRGGLRLRDKRIVIEQKINAAFQLDEPTVKNLALFVMATTPTKTTVQSGQASNEEITIYQGKWVPLAKRNVNVATNPFVLKSSDEQTTYEEGTDYEIFAEAGWLYVYEDKISDGATCKASYDYDATTKWTINASTSTTIEGDIYFLGDPASGRILDIKGKVTLQPEGELGLITESDWLAFGFNAEFILDSANYGGLAVIEDCGSVSQAA